MGRIVRFLVVFFICLLNQGLFAEGTKQMMPHQDTLCYLQIVCEPFILGTFATPCAPPERQIYFTIASTTEKVYFGFKRWNFTGAVSYSILNPLGVEVMTGEVSSTTAGYIATYNQAVTGPSAVTTGGYNALQYQPLMPGDYSIRFNISSWQYVLEFFDVTVVNASNQPVSGRLWSKKWNLAAQKQNNGYNYPLKCKLYVYSDDGLVTRLNLENLIPEYVSIICNAFGCSNTGDFIFDRQSLNGEHQLPQYKIFMNDPDSTIFPTGIQGAITMLDTSRNCDGSVTIAAEVTKSGLFEMLININSIPGYQTGDVQIIDSVYAGITNQFVWNGLNPNGTQVANGTPVSIAIRYIQGITHLPLYNVIKNDGIKLELIRPAGPSPAMYWDDHLVDPNSGTIYPPIVELGGCTSINGCHKWLGADYSTLNTWWYPVMIDWPLISFLHKRDQVFTTNASICQGDSSLFQGNWYRRDTAFVHSFLSYNGCDSTYNYSLVVHPQPVADLGPDVILCQGNSITLDAGPGPQFSYLWNTGATTQTIVVSASGAYSVTVNTPFNCTASDAMHVTYFAVPPPGPIVIKHN